MSHSSGEQAIQTLTRRFNLQAHPEGGYYSEVYRSQGVIQQSSLLGYPGDRNISTSIYFLITSGNFSGFHRIRQDELWHFYAGMPLHVHVIDSGGQYVCHTVGHPLTDEGNVPQLVVRGGSWFASAVRDPRAYSFVGCTVAPGFDFRDFELASRDQLTALFPKHAAIIQKFTRQ